MFHLKSNEFDVQYLQLESLKSFDMKTKRHIKLRSCDGLGANLPIRYKMFSPFLSDIIASFPVSSCFPTIIIPDCSSVTINHLANLLITGCTSIQSNDKAKDDILNAANILGLEIKNLVCDEKLTKQFPDSEVNLNLDCSEISENPLSVPKKAIISNFVKVASFAKVDPSTPNIMTNNSDEIIINSNENSIITTTNENQNITITNENSNIIAGSTLSDTKAGLTQQHQNLTNPGSGPRKIDIACHICSKEFKLLYKYEEHMNIHFGFKSFKCNICDYAATRKKKLEWHMSIHLSDHYSELKKFKCHICDFEGNRKTKLERHMSIHTGLKKFQCSLCDYSSVKKYRLSRHIATLHNSV